MIGSLVLFFVLLWVLTKDMRLKKKKERILRDNSFETATIIQYDARTVNVLGLLTMVSLVCTLVSYVMACYVEPEAGLLLVAFGGLFIIFLPSWLMGRGYLSRLRKWGYEIPWSGKDYDYILEKVPLTRENIETEAGNKRSRVFSLIYVYIWLCMLAVNVWFSCKWHFMGGIIIFIVLAVVDIYWLVRAWIYHKQISNEEFKEDIEIDKSRKNRTSLERAVCEMLVMLLVVWGIKSMFANYLDYVYRSQVEADRGRMKEIHGMMELIYKELVLPKEETTGLFTPEEFASDWSGTRQQLTEGVDITEWGMPQDIYQERLAEHFVISDFAELDNYFRSVKGDVVLFAKLENGVLILSIPNQKEGVESHLVIESQVPLPDKEY